MAFRERIVSLYPSCIAALSRGGYAGFQARVDERDSAVQPFRAPNQDLVKMKPI